MMRLFRQFKRSPKTLASVPAYALWAQNYPAHAHNTLMQLEESAMRLLMPDLAGKRILDLACGTGRYGRIADEGGAGVVMGLDNSHAMLERAEVAEVALATNEALPLRSASLDGVLCGLAIGHLPRVTPTLSEIARVLAPNGVALISDFHPFQFLRGAQRTFTAPDGRVFVVEHYSHLISHVITEAQNVGLHLSALQEPTYDGVPVVVVYRFLRLFHA